MWDNLIGTFLWINLSIDSYAHQQMALEGRSA